MTRTHAALAALGVAFGYTLSSAGFSDWTEIHRMFTLGLLDGGPCAASLRLLLAFAGAVALAMAAFLLLARRDALPVRPLTRATVPGALLFGAGWALCGACPAVVLVQLGEGKVAALASLAGMLGGLRLHRAARRALGWRSESCAGS
ncbi:MAG TPA: YeeE/YedE thiosulfate transporter family protein [Anaeromyxobacter sp.]|nr:YeeE/YedE thiosulfate transporter family protein [Anaeromyxobacter sp.]